MTITPADTVAGTDPVDLTLDEARSRRWSLGVVVGKFLPYHRGHRYLISEAASLCDRLCVMVSYRDSDPISVTERVSWISSEFPAVDVVEVFDDIPHDDPEISSKWATKTLALFAERYGATPQAAFTSEDYGRPWSEAMGADHVSVDPARETTADATGAVSGSRLRDDLASNFTLLAPEARADLAVRVVVLGVESSGTTTLARDLAALLDTVWVPEYGRFYWEGRFGTADADVCDPEEFVAIGEGQAALEDRLATKANRVLIADTDPLATCVWARRYLGGVPAELEELATSRRPDLYILTAPDFGFVQDGFRESAHLREEMHDWFTNAVAASGVPYIKVTGSPTERLETALGHVEDLLTFPALEFRPPLMTDQPASLVKETS